MSDFHRHSSWGRTRRPKNVNGATSTEQATTILAADIEGGSSADVNGSVPTENQRFLHLMLETASDQNVTVYGFSYALNRWAPLKDARGNDVKITVDTATAYQIFEIAGVDRLAFVRSGNITRFYAAMSTF